MNREIYLVIAIAIMAATTVLLRSLPFLIFRNADETPPVMHYLGRVLPSAIIGMLVIYCLKDVSLTSSPFGIPEILAGLMVVFLQVWKRNSLVSILAGTLFYMLLIHIPTFGA